MPESKSNIEKELDEIKDKVDNISRTLYGYDTNVGLMAQVYDLKRQIQNQNRLIFALLTIEVTQFFLLADLLLKLGL